MTRRTNISFEIDNKATDSSSSSSSRGAIV